jgi:thiamine-monophosphate kinase
MDNILENDFIEIITEGFKRSPWQKNKLQESDCELIGIPGSNLIIALTTDSIVEEIERGLYSDPYLIGWMTVIVNLSDLSAAGAEPIGILLNETLPPGLDAAFLGKLQNGIQEACEQHGIHVLGGDTNFSSKMQMSGCALGVIRDGSILTRVGCKPGDYFFSSGKLGQGSSYALLKMAGKDGDSLNSTLFKPKARIKEGQLLRKYASCCMDTSDGLIPAIDQLMRLNSTGFLFETEIEKFLYPGTLKVATETEIPPWMMLAGPHGEFELIFTIPANILDDFLNNAYATGWEPVKLGIVSEIQETRFLYGNNYISVDTAKIRNLFNEVNGDIEKYMHELFKINYLWKTSDRP